MTCSITLKKNVNAVINYRDAQKVLQLHRGDIRDTSALIHNYPKVMNTVPVGNTYFPSCMFEITEV